MSEIRVAASPKSRLAGALYDSLTLALIGGSLLLPTLLAHEMGWEIRLPVALFTLALGLLLHFALASSHFSDGRALLISLGYGICGVWIALGYSEKGDFAAGIRELVERCALWLDAAWNGRSNPDPLIFNALVAALLWMLSYNGIWYTLRSPALIRALLPPSALLIVNYLFAPQGGAPREYALAHLFIVLLLLARAQLQERAFRWRRRGLFAPTRLHIQNLLVAAFLSVLAFSLASRAPQADMQGQLDEFQEFLQSDPFQRVGEIFSRLVNVGDWEGGGTADYYGGDRLRLGGSIRLGAREVFWVEAKPDRRYYWRSRAFELYDGRNWQADVTTRLKTRQELEIQGEAMTGIARVSVPQSFTMGLAANRLIYAAPQPVYVSIHTSSELRYLDAEQVEMNLSVIRPERILRRGERYEVVSRMSVATAAQLRAAGEDYPQWLRETRSTHAGITERTRELAASIAAGADNAYDAARAVESWLRRNIVYDENIPRPPADQDAVDWFLFELRRGYCTYSATAMVTLLRALGIPARLAAGFAQGEYAAELERFVVRERDAHTWVEVYFPNYGWVEFEPTSAQAPISRLDDQRTPPPTMAPTPTAQPSPAPSATPSPAPNDAQAAPTPTLAPGRTPTAPATPLPVPPPRPQSPPPPPPPSLLESLFSDFVVLLGVFFALLLFFLLLLFLYWWWEWRGMRGLSPVARAYARLERYVALLGLRLRPTATTEERRSQIVSELPRAAERPVTQIARLYTRERYGPPAMGAFGIWQRGAETAWKRARDSILGRWFRYFFRRRAR